MTSDKKYIDFVGTHAAGKSTIKKNLFYALKKENLTVDTTDKKRSDYIEILVLFINNYKKFFDIIFSWRNYSIKKKYRKLGRKRALRINSLFYQSRAEIVLDESFLHKEVNSQNCKKGLKELISLLPDTEKYFVFVDTKPEVSFKRYIKRIGNKESKEIEKTLSDYKSYYENSKGFYEVLKDNEGKYGIKKIIKVDGEKKVEENVKIIMKEIVNGN